MKKSIKKSFENIARTVSDNDRLNSLFKSAKSADISFIKERMRKVKSSFFSMLVPENCDSLINFETDKKDIKDTSHTNNEALNSYCFDDADNNEVKADPLIEHRAKIVSKDNCKKDCKNDCKNDNNKEPLCQSVSKISSTASSIKSKADTQNTDDVLTDKIRDNSTNSKSSICSISKSSLFKRKDIRITSLNSQRVLRVSSVSDLLRENIYFTKAIREFLKAPVHNLNFYLNTLFYDFASLVSVLPASASLHDSSEGGLLSHSLHTALKSSELVKQYRFSKKYVSFNELEIVLVALLHDLAKIITDMSITDESSAYTYRPLFIRKNVFDSLDEDTRNRLLNTYSFRQDPFYKNILSVNSDPIILKESLCKNPEDSMYLELYPVSDFIKVTKSDFLFVSFTKKRSQLHDDIFRFTLSCFVKTQIGFVKKINRNKGSSIIHSILTDKSCKDVLELIKKADVYACFSSQQNNFGINCIENYLYEFINADLISHKDQGCYRLKNGYFIEYCGFAHQKLLRAFDCYYAINSKSVNISDDFNIYKKVVKQINALTNNGSITNPDEIFKKDFTYHPFFRTLVDTSLLTQRLYKRSCTYTELTDRNFNRFLVYGFFIRTDSFYGKKRNPEFEISFDILEKEVKTKLLPVLKNYILNNTDKAQALFVNLPENIDNKDLKKLFDSASFTYVAFKNGKSHLCLESLDEKTLCEFIDTDTLRVNIMKFDREKESDKRYRLKSKNMKISQLDIKENIKAQAYKEEQFLSSENDNEIADLIFE
ncbi:TraI domain-containing protein [Succinivibrio sp.]|uniref:TraI domain-containing protein n=1 Tax=Succinivibrio sp. TaxID=2053619 RepID=UPI00386E9413